MRNREKKIKIMTFKVNSGLNPLLAESSIPNGLIKYLITNNKHNNN